MAIDCIPRRLLEQAKAKPTEPAYYVKQGGSWKPTSWKGYADETFQAAKAMIGLGLPAKGTVTILGFNRPEWVIFDVACMMAGGAPAGIYTTCSPTEVQYIVDHAEAPLILVEDHSQWAKIKEVRDQLPKLKYVIMMKGNDKVDDDMVLSWEEFLAKAEGVEDSAVQERMDNITEEQLATFIYTSGTTGPPKGVMLSHKNLTFTVKGALEIIGTQEGDCSLSYLPLSHIAEQVFTIHAPISAGYSIYFAESIPAVADNLKEVQPTIFFGVPRIWEKFYAGITGKLGEAKGVKKMLVNWAMGVGEKVNALKIQNKQPTGFLKMQYGWANKLIFSKLKPAVGMGRARMCVSGAAPIAQEILEFFSRLDLIVHEVYGQSEDCGPTSFNLPTATRFGSVGLPFPGVEVKIADDDEILVRGGNVFLGYYKDEETTNKTLIDGWLHSGDLGKFDDQGFLYIIGRKKDIIITAGGKNITPKNIESAIKQHPVVGEAVLIGDRRKYITALISIDPEVVEDWAAKNGTTAENIHENEVAIKSIQDFIDKEVNPQFARVEQVKKFRILHRPLGIEEGELTPTLKVKRNKVNEHFADTIESMYAE